MSGKAEQTLNSGAAKQRSGQHLPARLAARISPEALERRARAVQARLEDQAQDRVYRRRSAELIAKHLLTTVSET
jgi:hypothetical protein